jgi:hypothetical protein
MTTHRIGLNSGCKPRQSIELGQNKFVCLCEIYSSKATSALGQKAEIPHCTRHVRYASGGATKSAFGCYDRVQQRVWLKPGFSVSIANRMP